MSQELLKKADMILADLSNAGRLNPEHSDRFIRVLMEQPTIIKAARTIPMSGPETKINKIGFGSRILRPGVENTALAEADRSKPETFQIVLQTQEVIAEVRIPYASLEDNIEKDNLQNTILDMIAARAALDFEELTVLGDTASADPYLAMFDGFLKRFTSNVYDASTTHNTAPTYTGALKLLAPRFRRNLNLLGLYVSPNTTLGYRELVATRQTILGDAVLVGSAPIGVAGLVMNDVSMMPNEQGLLVNPKNLIIGIQRDFQIESQRFIRERQIVIVLTARFAMGVETEEAGVHIVGLPA